MNINIDLYRIFYIVAINESISAAAQSLYISQPAITFQIKKLEELLGVSLFSRTKHGVKLTEEGKILFEYVKNAMDNISNGENALTNLKNLDSGVIRIGSSTTVCKHIVMPYLAKFHELYPNIEIQIINNLTSNLIKELRNGNIDILVLNLPMEKSKDLKIIKIKDVEDILVGNKKYFDLTNGKLDIKNIEDYPLILQKSPSNTRNYINNYFKINNIIPKPKLEVVSYNLIMDLISGGFGIGFATKEFIKNELDNNLLYEIKLSPKIDKRYVGIVLMDKKTPNYSVNKLIELMTK